ncbi:hypothetical protein G6682_01945 [Polynucleobacter paneuropaeus]|nr:hypothetical protein G6682_01945 [Polynucleobacter paneuropaeus]
MKAILLKSKLNFAVLASILLLIVMGKNAYPAFTQSVFISADQLVSDLILVFVAITLGAFIANFAIVVLGCLTAFVVASILVYQGLVFQYLTQDYLVAVLIVVLGFAAIANLYRLYQAPKA